MKPIKILLVEDSKMDERLILRQLAKADYDVRSIRVQTAADMKAALAAQDWEIILSDYIMPGFTGLDALRVLKESGRDIPFIIISGIIGEETAVEAMRAGVNDYLMKDNLMRLAPAIEREVENAVIRRAQKQAEEALRLSEANLADAQRIAHIGSWDHDLKNNYLRWSEEVYLIFGLDKEQVKDTSEAFFNAIHPEDKQTVQSAADAAMSQLAPYNIEHRIIRPDGEERIVCEIGEVIFDEAGKPVRFIGTVQDITERKANEREMRLMKSAIDSIVEGIIISDARKSNNPVIYVNTAFESLTGYTSGEIEGLSCRVLQGAETDRRTIDKIRESLKNEQTFRGEILNYHKNGTPFWNELRISPVFDRWGHLTNFVGTQQDISKRKEDEAKLRSSEARFNQLVKSSIIGIIITNLNGSIIEANDVFLKTVGYSRKDLAAGKLRWDEMTPPELLWQDERAKKQLADFGYSKPREKEYIRKDRSRVPVLVGGTLLEGAENTVLAFVLDISERKRSEEALRESELRLRTIVETEPECVKILGLRGELLEMNPAGLAMIEADSIEQVRGAAVINIVAPEHRRAFAKLTKSVLAGSTEILEFETIGLKGTRRWLETHAVPMRSQAGEITSLLSVTRDITERKRAEEQAALLTAQLRQQHERLNNIIANVPGIVWEVWGETDEAIKNIDFVSDYVEEMLGYTVEEWLTTPDFWLTVIHPEDHKKTLLQASENFKGIRTSKFDARMITKDGRVIWTEVQTQSITNSANKVIGVRGITIDITERKRLEEERTKLIAELDFEKARLQDIFDNSPSFIVSMRGPDYVYETVNPAYYELVGQRNLLGIPAFEALPEVVGQGYMELLDRVYSTGEPFIGSERLVKLQPSHGKAEKQAYLDFTYMPMREADGSISGILSYGVDVTEQVLSRTKVQESEERYRFLFENNPLPMWAFDVETLAFLSVNNAAINHYGYSLEEFSTMTLKDIRLPGDIPVFLENISKDIAGVRNTGVVRHKKKDGTLIWVEITSSQLIFDGRKAKLVLANDITERRKAEESIRFQAHLLDTVEQSVIATDLDGIVTYWNQFAQKLYGWTVAEAVGRDIKELTTPEIEHGQAARIMTQLSMGRSWSGEFPVRNKDGKSFPAYVSNSPVNDSSGNLIGIVGVSIDITERKASEAALREAEDKYRNLVESSPAIVYFAEPDPPFSPIYISPNVTRFGYTTEEWFDKPDMWVSLIHDDDRARVLRATEDAIKLGSETDLEYRIVARDGAISWLHDKGHFVKDEQGNKTGWQGVMIDITKTKGLEEQLRQSQKLESIGLLTGGIAHDFNNMLTAINGYSELTLRRLKIDDPLRHNLEEIRKAGKRSADLTHQLLAFSRQQVLQPVVTDLNNIIADTIKMLQRLIGENIQLTTTLNPKAGQVKVDPGQFSQIIMNLSVNARDAMPEGGKLTIETTNVFLAPEYTRHHVGVLPGAYVLLAVSDTGIGMSSETRQHIFEPFFTTKSIGQGTGLGLATVYGIVKQSGGAIQVYSEEGIGTTFKIYLPRVAEQINDAKIDVPSAELPEGSETILLVEDEEMVRNLSKDILETCGYTVIEARNGLEALEIWEKGDHEISLLITDVVMPLMGGRELAEKLSAKLPNLQILFTSGYTDDAVVRHGVIEANTNFIQKPFTFDALSRKVRDMLDAKRF